MPSTPWHGFSDLWALAKATASLTLTLSPILVAGMYAIVTNALDERYVQGDDLDPKLRKVEQRVVEQIDDKLSRAARDRDCKNVIERLEDLEDRIEYKKQRNEDHGLEDKQWRRANREFNILNHCVR